MTTRAPAPARTAFPALGTTAVLLVTDPSALPVATAALHAELATVDLRCSRFRPDSELTRVNLGAGTSMTVSAYFAEALRVALRAARITDGAVDPTVGRAVIALGYDCTFASVRPDDARPLPVSRPAPGWQRIVFDPHTRRLRLPPHTRLDLGACWSLRCNRSEVEVKVATLDVLSALTRPLQRDVGILARTPAVEFCP